MESNRQRRAAIVVSSLAILLVIVALVRVMGGARSDGTDRLPSVELSAGRDETLSTDDLVGGPLVINFWYAACPPCANELKHFATAHEKFGNDVRFVGVNAIDTIEEMTAFAAERGVSYELYQDRLAELQTEMRLTSFPTTLFVSADGSIVERTGVLDESSLESGVLELLAVDS